METYRVPPGPLPEWRGEAARRRTDQTMNKTRTEDSSIADRLAPQAIDATNAEDKARHIAEVIQERTGNGYYHRMDVLREVVSRLLDSHDLERVNLELN